MNNIKKKLLPVITFAKIDTKRLFRDKLAIFFVFIFPLIFLLIFGTINKGGNDVSFRVALINNSNSDFAKEFEKQLRGNKIFKVDTKSPDFDKAKERMNRSQIDAAIILPEGFGDFNNQTKTPSGELEILYSSNNQSAGSTLGSIMEGIFKEVNAELVQTKVPFTVKLQTTATPGLTQFDYTFAGLLGFTLLSLGIFGPTNVFPRLKQKGVLRRYSTTPLKVWQYFTGNVISNAAVGLIAVALMFAAAFRFFDLHMRGSYLDLLVVILLGLTVMFGIGLAIGGWAKNENQAAPLSQLTTLPMMFLSGVFFPVFLMPEMLQKITRFIPLTPIIDSVRMVVTEGKGLMDLGSQLGIMFAWLIIIYVIAFRVFRWE